jgi:hypothetical protein
VCSRDAALPRRSFSGCIRNYINKKPRRIKIAEEVLPHRSATYILADVSRLTTRGLRLGCALTSGTLGMIFSAILFPVCPNAGRQRCKRLVQWLRKSSVQRASLASRSRSQHLPFQGPNRCLLRQAPAVCLFLISYNWRDSRLEGTIPTQHR